MTLENKLGLTDDRELASAEERLGKKRAIELFDSGMLDAFEPGAYETLAKFHGQLFCDVYDFAGVMREVDISDGNSLFTPVRFLTMAVMRIQLMPQSSFDQIIEKYVEMNLAHPFLEGNGRAMRIWLNGILKYETGQVVDWSLVDRESYLQAMEDSLSSDASLKELLKPALTSAVDDRDVFLHGIDASFAFGGLAAFRAEEL